jgi:hypothetical protein
MIPKSGNRFLDKIMLKQKVISENKKAAFWAAFLL